jgi:hypothetical protein
VTPKTLKTLETLNPRVGIPPGETIASLLFSLTPSFDPRGTHNFGSKIARNFLKNLMVGATEIEAPLFSGKREKKRVAATQERNRYPEQCA